MDKNWKQNQVRIANKEIHSVFVHKAVSLKRNKLLLHFPHFFQLYPCISHCFVPQNTAVTEKQKSAYTRRKIMQHRFDLTTNEGIKEIRTNIEQSHCMRNCFFLLVHTGEKIE